jgi:hypothetical protein
MKSMDRVIRLLSPERLAGLAPHELERALVDAERHRRMIEAAMIDVLDEADRRRVWARDGHVSVRGWASALTGVSQAENRRRLQTMRARRDLDLVRER